MEERSERANVVFRVVEDQLWPFPEGAAVAPPAVVAVDCWNLRTSDPDAQAPNCCSAYERPPQVAAPTVGAAQLSRLQRRSLGNPVGTGERTVA